MFERDDTRLLNPDHVGRIRRVLSDLEFARQPQDLNWPGYRVHALGGKLRGYWAVRISGNWRIVFRFAHSEVVDVDLVDYH